MVFFKISTQDFASDPNYAYLCITDTNTYTGHEETNSYSYAIDGAAYGGSKQGVTDDPQR